MPQSKFTERTIDHIINRKDEEMMQKFIDHPSISDEHRTKMTQELGAIRYIRRIARLSMVK
jgi:succinate dehydrogenase flavin-adding protein (antitoxin of CptAB toxin-antitoxin module)